MVDVDWGMTRLGQRNHVLDGGTHGCHLANTIKQSVLGGNVGCHYTTITVVTCYYYLQDGICVNGSTLL